MKKATNSRLAEVETRKGSKRTRTTTDDGFWDCSFCTFKNKSDKVKCDMCAVARGSSTRRPRLNHVTQQFAKIESQIEQEYKKVKKKDTKKKTTKRVSDNSSPSLSNPRTVSITVKGITVNITEYDMNELASNAASTSSKQDRENISDNDTMNDGDTLLQSSIDESMSESSDEDYLDKSAAKRTNGASSKKKSNKRKFNTSKGNESSESISVKKKKSKRSIVHPASDQNSSIEESHSPNTSTSSKLIKSDPNKDIKDAVSENDSDSIESNTKPKEMNPDKNKQVNDTENVSIENKTEILKETDSPENKTEIQKETASEETGNAELNIKEKALNEEKAETMKDSSENPGDPIEIEPQNIS